MNKKNKYHIINEDTEDTYDTTNDIEEAIKIAHLALTQDYYGGIASILELDTGKVIKQFTNKSGPVEEIPIVEDYTTTWKKTTKIQIGRVNKVFEKFNQLIAYLNDYPGIRIAYIETPKLTVGQHTYGPITIDVYLTFDSDGAWISRAKRNELMVLAGLLSEKYDVLEWKIGFDSVIKLPSHISSTLTTDKGVVHGPSRAIMKMTLAIEEPQYPESIK